MHGYCIYAVLFALCGSYHYTYVYAHTHANMYVSTYNILLKTIM